jgi:hypothetical protein
LLQLEKIPRIFNNEVEEIQKFKKDLKENDKIVDIKENTEEVVLKMIKPKPVIKRKREFDDNNENEKKKKVE